MTYTPKSSPRMTRPIILILGLLVLGIGLVGLLEITGKTHIFHKAQATTHFKATPTTGGASTFNDKGEQVTAQDTAPQSGNTQPGDAKSPTAGSEQTVLVAPSGDFVSNHHPNLGGSPAPNTMTSVCTTTPGATCTINFSKDGTTKSLRAQTTDRGGSAYWNWKLQDIGLTTGSWKITATASINGQTKSTSDALALEVSQ